MLFAPDVYLGPSGSDRVFLYSWARSVVFDQDTDLRNEIQTLPPSSDLILVDGRPVNKYPFGSPLLALPAMAATKAAWSQLDDRLPTGYERPFIYSYAVSQLLAALMGLYFTWCSLTRYLTASAAAIGVASASIGTELVRQTAVDLMQSHAASMLGISAMFLACLRLRENPTGNVRWFVCGLASGFALVTRLQNAPYAAVVALTIVPILLEQIRTGRFRASSWLALLAGALTLVGPQLAFWASNATMAGLASSGDHFATGYEQEMHFSWLHPNLAGLSLFLARWFPFLLLAFRNSVVVATRGRDYVLGSLFAAWLATIYLTATFWEGHAVWIAPRSTFDCLLPSALGVGLLAQSVSSTAGLLLVVMVPAVCNLPFLTFYPVEPYRGLARLAADWQLGLRLLTGWAR